MQCSCRYEIEASCFAVQSPNNNKDDPTTSAFLPYRTVDDILSHLQQIEDLSIDLTEDCSQLDASFVQIPTSSIPSHPVVHGGITSAATATEPKLQLLSDDARSHFYFQHERNQELAFLQTAVLDPANAPALCAGCVQRIERALDADSDRLRAECEAYKDVVREDEAREKTWKQMINRAAMTLEQGQEVVAGDAPADSEQSLEAALRNELTMLEEECQQHRNELLQLRALHKEQALLDMELDITASALAEEHNALELAARAFHNEQEQLSRTLAEIQNEWDCLCSPYIKLPSILLNLQVDAERGLRYPLINELRLAYRPKGDLRWQEIQAAWALAAQLLLMIGTLFQFQSQHWKIVPLTQCAKLIYCPPMRSEGETSGSEAASRPRIFNLGHPKTHGSRALLTWNALLCQMIQHVKTKMDAAIEHGVVEKTATSSIPFASTPTSIGNISLTQLDDNDDRGWSRVTHLMASNLLWLSDCASCYIRKQVLLGAPVARGKLPSPSVGSVATA